MAGLLWQHKCRHFCCIFGRIWPGKNQCCQLLNIWIFRLQFSRFWRRTTLPKEWKNPSTFSGKFAPTLVSGTPTWFCLWTKKTFFRKNSPYGQSPFAFPNIWVRIATKRPQSTFGAVLKTSKGTRSSLATLRAPLTRKISSWFSLLLVTCWSRAFCWKLVFFKDLLQ